MCGPGNLDVVKCPAGKLGVATEVVKWVGKGILYSIFRDRVW